MASVTLPGRGPLPIAAVVFDAYGTLLDVHSALVRVMVGGTAALDEARARALSVLWRDKQLAYTWLRNAMRAPADFAVVTAEALDHALDAHGLAGERALRAGLLEAYRALDPYPEVPGALAALRGKGVPCAVLSNGTPEMLAAGLASAEIAQYLDEVLSVEALGVYKPAPEVYALATRRFGAKAAEILFLSANGWDVHGASAFGLTVIHVNRQAAVDERLPGGPAHRLESLAALPELVSGA